MLRGSIFADVCVPSRGSAIGRVPVPLNEK